MQNTCTIFVHKKDEMTNGGSVGKGIGLAFFSEEIVTLVYDLRWAVLLCVVLIIADLWLGCRSAIADGDKVRRSRAIRRTANKFIDYIMYMLVASMMGMVIEQLGWWQHTHVALCGILLGCFCELESIISHWAHLHGFNFSLSKFALSLIRKKKTDIASAIDDAQEQDEKE